MNEWSLLLFTLLMQMAVGAVLMITLSQTTVFATLDKTSSEKVIRLPLFITALISAIALIASFAHLGNPLHALNTLRHVGSSWMSREILFTSLFLLLMAWLAFAVVFKRDIPKGGLWATVVVGVLLLLSMSATYINTIFLYWRSPLTYIAFFGTALLLGSMLALCLLPLSLKQNDLDSYASTVSRLAIKLALVGAVLCLIATIVMPAVHTGAPLSETLGARAVPDSLASLTVLRYFFVAMGLMLAFMAVRKANISFALIALALTIAGEALGRYVFFSLGA